MDVATSHHRPHMSHMSEENFLKIVLKFRIVHQDAGKPMTVLSGT